MKTNCKHKRAYYFHENAPLYCPDCNQYIDGNEQHTKEDVGVKNANLRIYPFK